MKRIDDERKDMKKLFFTLLMTASLVSCSNDEVVDGIERQAISFGNVFVDKATRAASENDPTYTKDNLDGFYVYGNVYGNVTGQEQTVNLYSGAYVKKVGNAWDCAITQYWVPNCSYIFAAVTDVDNDKVKVKVENGLPKSISYDVSCQKDLLYASANESTNADGTPNAAGTTNGNVNPVSFSFNHLLAKVKFTFTNNFAPESGVELTVTDIKITNAANKAIYTFNPSKPWDKFGDLNATISLGDTEKIAAGNKGESTKKAMLIPHAQQFDITFTVKHNKGGSDTTKNITTKETVTLEVGHFYNFIAELNSSNVEGVVPITFQITEGTWGNEETNDVTGPYPII